MARSVVIVDIDDTLYLERDYVCSGFRYLDDWCLRVLGVAGVGGRAWDYFEAGVRNTTITDAMTDLGLRPDEATTRQVVAAYRQHAPGITLLPDARLCLDALGRDHALGVITDGPVESQRAKFAALGLDRWIPRPVFTSEHGLSKPDPRVFELAAEWTGGNDRRYTYVADNPLKDFQGPLALGWGVVRVRRPGSLHEALATPPDVREIETMDGLRTLDD